MIKKVVEILNLRIECAVFRIFVFRIYSEKETWSLTLREGRKLRVFENMVLRGICGPRRDEVTGEWRRLHNEELNDLYNILCTVNKQCTSKQDAIMQ